MTPDNFRYFNDKQIIERRPQYFNFDWSASPIMYVHECVFSIETFHGTLRDFILHSENNYLYYIHSIYFD